MSRVREKRINKLRKHHIWPTIVFSIISLVVSFIVWSFFMDMLLSYFAVERLNTVYDDVTDAKALFNGSEGKNNEDQIIRFLETKPNHCEAVYILDKNNNIINGYGGDTFSVGESSRISLMDERELEFYFDKNKSHMILDDDGDITFNNVAGNIYREGRSVLKPLLNYKKREPLIEEDFWIKTDIPGDRILLMKSRVTLYNKDINIAMLSGLSMVIILFIAIIFLLRNVITSIHNQKRVTKLLYMDTVTYGHNWLYFEENAEKLLTSKRESVKLYAMADVVLMKYRNYCTYHGVDEGEELLESIDKYLTKKISRKTELCAHNGRASFALLLQCYDYDSCIKRVDAMLDELTANLGHSGIAYHAGIYFIEPEKNDEGKIIRRKTVDVDDFYNCAVSARSSIPEDNPKELAVFDQKLLDDKLWEHHVEEKMQRALDNEEFAVYIQPKYNPVTEKLAGAEALVRWINDEDGFVPPGKFIPIFEKNGFITKLDDYMISHIAQYQSQWIAEGKEVVPVSVNVSRAHFVDENLAEHICGLVDKYGTPHNVIEIELTESAFFDDKNVLLNTVRKLQEKGFEVSMDDFGAGYSSLNSLKDLPLDVLKLDADFFRGEDGENRGEIVVAEAIALAKKLNMKIVAEGIEKKEQVDFLAKHDCDMIQGYYFAKPMPTDEYAQRMTNK